MYVCVANKSGSFGDESPKVHVKNFIGFVQSTKAILNFSYYGILLIPLLITRAIFEFLS